MEWLIAQKLVSMEAILSCSEVLGLDGSYWRYARICTFLVIRQPRITNSIFRGFAGLGLKNSALWISSWELLDARVQSPEEACLCYSSSCGRGACGVGFLSCYQICGIIGLRDSLYLCILGTIWALYLNLLQCRYSQNNSPTPFPNVPLGNSTTTRRYSTYCLPRFLKPTERPLKAF